MKKTVEFQIDAETRIRITRYSGTGRVNVHLLTTNCGCKCIYKFACSVGDLSEDVQVQLERFGMGKTRDRRTKHKYSKAWQEQGFLIDCCSSVNTEEVLRSRCPGYECMFCAECESLHDKSEYDCNKCNAYKPEIMCCANCARQNDCEFNNYDYLDSEVSF